MFKTQTRYRGVQWGNANLALITEGLRNKQTNKVSLYTQNTGTVEELYSRNQTDAYGNPGNPLTTKNQYGRQVIRTVDQGTKLLMNNPIGSSEKGDMPFLAKFDLASKKLKSFGAAPKGALNMRAT